MFKWCTAGNPAAAPWRIFGKVCQDLGVEGAARARPGAAAAPAEGAALCAAHPFVSICTAAGGQQAAADWAHDDAAHQRRFGVCLL